MTLEIDFETQSASDIKSEGVYRYMLHPTTRPLFCSYKLDGGKVQRWDASEPCPVEIQQHVESGGSISAHNAGFERLLWQYVLATRYGWPMPQLEQFRCTAATAAAMSLPRALKGVGQALNLPIQKDDDGWRLIRKFSLPRKAKKGDDPNGTYFNTPADYPDDWAKFKDYCDTDVETEAAADARMVPLSAAEQQRYIRSERINDRGVRVDVASIHAALELADKAKKLLDREMTLTTEGYVTACSQVARLTAWIEAQGVTVTSLGKADIDDLLATDDMPERVTRSIQLRQEAAKTSVAKLQSFIERVCPDGRIRGAFLFRAAGTGRYSSVGVQLHNMPRPRKEFSDANLDSRLLFEAFKSRDPDFIKTLYGEKLGRTLWLLSDAIRGFIWADPGKELIVADYSGIEGAVAAWLAGEQWKLEALFEIIADHTLPDLYRRTAAGIYNTTTTILTKKDPRRQVGKVAELALGYQGGVMAFFSMARAYGLDLDEVYGPVWEAATLERQEAAVKRYEECLSRNEASTQKLSRKAWLAAELIKVGWRATNPAITVSWNLLQDAIYEAIQNPGSVVTVLKLKYVVKRGFLWCMLPSGRCLAYGNPQIREIEVPWADKTQPADKREKRMTPTALGVNSVTKKWERFALYGGLAFENAVQAIALDLLENGIEKAEEAGYPVVLHVHDEIGAEVPRGFGSVKAFEALICELPEWAKGLPLTAEGWRGKRYRK